MSDGATRPRVPERTCIGCRRKSGPAGLVRIARRPDGILVVGRSEPGRGAWLCAGSDSCFEAASKRRAFSRALRAEVSSQEIVSLRGRLLNDKLEGVGGA